jgi:hypothetical protein
MPYAIGASTAAVSAITNSSGATITIPHLNNATIRIKKILIWNGPALVGGTLNITMTPMSTVTIITFPFSETLSGGSFMDADFGQYGTDCMPTCNAQSTDVVVTIPALLGGAYSFAKIDYEYI